MNIHVSPEPIVAGVDRDGNASGIVQHDRQRPEVPRPMEAALRYLRRSRRTTLMYQSQTMARESQNRTRGKFFNGSRS